MNNWKTDLINAILELDNKTRIEIKQPFIPNKLYKYCPLNEYSLKNISSNTIWLSYPENVNDPYDTSITVALKRLANDSFRNGDYWKKVKRRDFTDEEIKIINNSEDCTETFKNILIAKYPRNRAFIENILKEQDDKKHRIALEEFNGYLRSLLRFCSFSERLDSVLMWSHYADNHKGICLEYRFLDAPNLSQYLYPIIYDDNLFDWTPHMDDPSKIYGAKILAAIHKAKDWEYEKEWRLLSAREDNKRTIMGSLPKLKPTAIYLGSKVDFNSENFRILKQQSEKQRIPVFEMVLSAAKFQMEPHLIYRP